MTEKTCIFKSAVDTRGSMVKRIDERRIVRLNQQERQQINKLRERAQAKTGVEVTFPAMVHAVLGAGVKQLSKRK